MGEGAVPLSHEICWEEIGPSRASTRTHPRALMRGFLPLEGINQLDGLVLGKQLREIVEPFEGFVGESGMYADKSCLLMELTCWDAVQGVLPLLGDVVAISPKWGLIRTHIRAEQWADTLSDLMRNNPYECILRIVWRQSLHGGRPWALPAATSQQIQAVRSQARQKLSNKGANDEALKETNLKIRGGLGPEPKGLLTCLMKSVQEKIATPLEEVVGDRQPGPGQWTMCLDPSSGNPSGRIRIKLASSQQARKLEDLMGNQVLNLGGTLTTVEAFNLQSMALPKCQGN